MAEASVVPLSRSTRSLSDYVAKRMMTLGQANGIPLSAYTNENNHRSSITQRLEPAKEMQQELFEVERQGTTAALGTSGSYDRSATTKGRVQAVSVKKEMNAPERQQKS
jgi:hypothetical protein